MTIAKNVTTKNSSLSIVSKITIGQRMMLLETKLIDWLKSVPSKDLTYDAIASQAVRLEPEMESVHLAATVFRMVRIHTSLTPLSRAECLEIVQGITSL
jgi:hypothetical protein